MPVLRISFPLSARERIAMTLDEGRLTEFDADLYSEDPLVSRVMRAKLEAAKEELRT